MENWKFVFDPQEVADMRADSWMKERTAQIALSDVFGLLIPKAKVRFFPGHNDFPGKINFSLGKTLSQ